MLITSAKEVVFLHVCHPSDYKHNSSQTFFNEFWKNFVTL